MKHAVFVCLLAMACAACAAESKALKKANLESSEGLFSSPKVLEVSIDVPQAQLDRLKSEPRIYVKAAVKEGSNLLDNTGFRFKGRDNINSARPSFTLKFNEFITDQRFQGQRKLGFESSAQDPTYLSEAVANELFRTSGIPAPRNTFARVRLNGKDVGLYVVAEGVNKDFLDKHFDKSKGNLYEGDGTDITDAMDKDSGDDSKDQSDLKTLAAAAREPNLQERWKKLQMLVDTERFITFAAMEVLLGHTNGYSLSKGRFRIYHDPGTDLLVFLPHGIETAFGKPDAPIMPEMKGLLAKAVLETPEGKKRYREEMSKLLTKVSRLSSAQSRIKELAGQIKPALKDSVAHDKAVNELVQRVATRHKFVEAQLKQP
ncbi:MAG: CotH kinase family protein [Verrucomicrobia subdivision 3 bacterium]|nr:CotH kinase family protein [Limisphaerales bacterium]